MAKWKCSCGYEENEGKFCVNCGLPMPAEEVAAPAVEEVEEEAAPIAEPVAEAPAQPAEPQPQAQPQPQPQPQAQPQPQTQAQPVQQAAPSYQATANEQTSGGGASLAFGIMSLVFFLVQPLGLVLAIVGLITSKGKSSGKAHTGRVLSIVGLVIGIVFGLLDLLCAIIIWNM